MNGPELLASPCRKSLGRAHLLTSDLNDSSHSLANCNKNYTKACFACSSLFNPFIPTLFVRIIVNLKLTRVQEFRVPGRKSRCLFLIRSARAPCTPRGGRRPGSVSIQLVSGIVRLPPRRRPVPVQPQLGDPGQRAVPDHTLLPGARRGRGRGGRGTAAAPEAARRLFKRPRAAAQAGLPAPT